MKTTLKTITLLASAALFTLTSLSAVETDPVGYVTVDVAANGFTFIGTPLVTATEYSGQVDSVASSTINFASSPFEVNEYAEITIGTDQVPQYVVEFTNGSDVGTTLPVISNTLGSVTVSEDVSGFADNTTTIVIRKLHTLDSLFPAGSPLTGSFTAASADEVLIFDSGSQSSVSYFYSTIGSEWRSGTGIANGSRSILPNQAIYIQRKSGPTSITFTGNVKMGTSAIDIFPGYNLIPNSYPVAYSFNLSGLYTGNPSTGLKAGFSSAIADEVIVYAADATPTTYFYSSINNQWESATGSFSGEVAIPAGGALMINRKASEGAFSWVKTQPF